jgi:tetratricopeptide (TPR) repeat protein
MMIIGVTSHVAKFIGLRATLYAAVLLSAAVAFAQRDDVTARARQHFEAGKALYSLGNYPDAIREFSAGYALAARPQFLLNLGQCYRMTNDYVKAREMYQRFLRDTPDDAPMRAEVKEIIVELDRDIEAAKHAPPPKPTPPQAKEVKTVPDAAVTTAPPAKKKPFIKRHWWIIPVSILVAAGVATGLGVGLTQRSSDPCAGHGNVLACWDYSGIKL